MTPFLFVLLLLGVARVTWFITEDHLPIIEKPRTWLVDRNPDSTLAYLVNCWWCVSIYVGAGASAFSVWVIERGLGLEPWESFLTLWPAFSFSAVLVMLAADVLMAHGTDDE